MSRYSRMHYEDMAAQVRELHAPLSVKVELVAALVGMFMHDNTNVFQPSRFIRACGLSNAEVEAGLIGLGELDPLGAPNPAESELPDDQA